MLTALFVGIAAALSTLPTGGRQYTLDEPVNPLVPVFGSYIHTSVIVACVVAAITTLTYLLVRAQRLRS